jgi:hypothetical protein
MTAHTPPGSLVQQLEQASIAYEFIQPPAHDYCSC